MKIVLGKKTRYLLLLYLFLKMTELVRRTGRALLALPFTWLKIVVTEHAHWFPFMQLILMIRFLQRENSITCL